MSKEKLQPEYPNSRTAEFDHGSITYTVYGEPNPEHNPIIWVSGAEQGRVNPKDIAETLAKKGQRQVLIYEQPVYSQDVPAKYKIDTDNALNFLAEGVLAAAEDAGLIGEGKVVDAAGHSLGGLVLDRIKQQAESRGMESFSQKKGSRQVLIAPTGSNDRENLVYLGGRWVPYMIKSMAEAKILDPEGLKGPALQKNTMADVPKFIGETAAMAKERINYHKFGEALVLVYPEDRMFPENGPAKNGRKHGFVHQAIENGYPLSFATPVNPEQVMLKGAKRLVAKVALGTKARHDYVRSHRGAGHNDPTDNPDRTVNTILAYLDNQDDILNDLKERNKVVAKLLGQKKKL